MKVESANKCINILDLPKEVLSLIFAFLPDHDLNSTSTVCKIFYSMSSASVRKLTIKDPSISYQDVFRLLQRFPLAKEINIGCSNIVGDVLLAISNSSSVPESMQICLRMCSRNVEFLPSKVISSVKTLKLSFDDYYRTSCVDNIVHQNEGENIFSYFARFSASNPYFDLFDDDGVRGITNKFPNLRKMDLSHPNGWLTDMTLDILSSYCPNLESVNFLGCSFSAVALCTFLCNNPKVTSIDMPFLGNSVFQVAKWEDAVKHLYHISMEGHSVSDEVLSALAESQPLLKSLIIRPDPPSDDLLSVYNCTVDGLSQLLRACSGLERLIVHLPVDNNCESHDNIMSSIVVGLPCLKHIKVTSTDLCQATLFSLVQHCPLLETISLERFGNMSEEELKRKKETNGYLKIPTEKNHSIRTIKISPEADIWLHKQVEFYCPKLEKQRKGMH